MIRSILAAGALLTTIAAPALAAGDLIYAHRSAQEIEPLKGYHGQPYWRVLAECAGAHGVLSNHYEAMGETRAAAMAKQKGVGFLRTANERLKTDRGLTFAQALELTTVHVDLGRESGSALLSRPAASGYSHEQLLDLMCSQVEERHARAVRFRSR